MTVESQARRPERLSPDQVQEIRSRAREAAGQVLDYYWTSTSTPSTRSRSLETTAPRFSRLI